MIAARVPRLVKVACASAAFGLSLAAPSPALAAAAPDLAVSVSGPSTTGQSTPFTESVTVTNEGTAAATGITVSYSTGTTAISPSSVSGMSCTYVQYGHSGRGGGVTTVGMSCSETLAAGLAPGQSVIVPMVMTENSPQTLKLTFTASPYPVVAQLNLVSHTTSVSVVVVHPLPAAAPTAVSATESGDQLNVSWTPAPATAPYISNSKIIATPVGGSTAPVLTAVIPGAATSGAVPGVVASTQYSITVANNDAGGLGATSQPFLFTTDPASVVPGAPRINYAYGYADIGFAPSSAGNSAIDEYEVLATGGG